MIGWYLHGWGYGPAIWDQLAALLPDLEPRFANLGYGGNANDGPPDEPAIWITHSFGTMHALAKMAAPDMPLNCRALVAINGFDRFAASPGFEGVPPRVLDRMIARFASDPAGVVSDFCRKCGKDTDVELLDDRTLKRDLVALRDMDCREQAAALSIPVLSLQGAADPVLPPAMRAAVLTGAHHVTHASAGHLLPLEQPAWCAHQIAEFRAEFGL